MYLNLTIIVSLMFTGTCFVAVLIADRIIRRIDCMYFKYFKYVIMQLEKEFSQIRDSHEKLQDAIYYVYRYNQNKKKEDGKQD
jgi:hypothetical protein